MSNSETQPVEADDIGVVTILFVDDEPNVLDALRRSTRRWRHVWDTHFASGGEEALQMFDEHDHFDIVVTDMRMPTMDGAELLLKIRDRSPGTARIILSGQSDHEAVLRAIGPAHQYLSKPCDIEELANVVEHLRGAADRELCDPVRTLISQTDRLPSPPDIFQNLNQLMASPRWTTRDVADLLAEDVALTAEILKLVNSAFFGYYGEVSSVERAVALLGVDLIGSVVLGNKVFLPDAELEEWLDLDLLDWRSKSVAQGARSLALRSKAPAQVAATAYLAGMMCEIGLLVMARVRNVGPNVASPLNTVTFLDAERALFGGHRFEVGCQLLRLWGFSPGVVEAIAQLASPDRGHIDGVAWYLLAARELVLDGGFSAADLADDDGSNTALATALEEVRTAVLDPPVFESSS